ncbi:uncharacterized protein L969DRAFT_88006 [Mixia osmundae IAM 14324]|nr:uncharacterized protein L969DRAFT_88006 [Mixia osmundae IAM 14324]KEI38736.1 hypothetical protein L969DRAFT_88006 [Mixia osmundae IAM 14324]
MTFKLFGLAVATYSVLLACQTSATKSAGMDSMAAMDKRALAAAAVANANAKRASTDKPPYPDPYPPQISLPILININTDEATNNKHEIVGTLYWDDQLLGYHLNQAATQIDGKTVDSVVPKWGQFDYIYYSQYTIMGSGYKMIWILMHDETGSPYGDDSSGYDVEEWVPAGAPSSAEISFKYMHFNVTQTVPIAQHVPALPGA